MKNSRWVSISILLLAICVAALAALGQNSTPPAAPKEATLTISGDVATSLKLTVEDLHGMPRSKATVVNEHDGKPENYEGVALAELLKRAGVPQGPQLRGPAIATYVLAEAADGYRAVFSVEETDPAFEDSDILVADTMNGAPMGDKLGPFRLIVPHEKRPARWVRMLLSLKVVTVPK